MSCNLNPPPAPFEDELQCSGYNLSGGALFSYWEQNNCIGTLSTILGSNSDGTFSYNPNNLTRVQNDVNNLFCTYQNTNVITDSTTSPGFNSFQNTLLAMCLDSRLPGVCDQAMKQRVCSNQTRNTVSNSRVFADFCGCYVPINQSFIKYTENEACDPLCHRSSTVQLSNPATGELLSCADNICVIDDINVNLNQSTVGGITFNQLCGGCVNSSSPCECIISGVNVTNTMSQVGIGAQFNQLCGPNSVCLAIQGNNDIVVPCQTVNPNNLPIPNLYEGIPWIILLAIFIFIIIVIAVFLIYRR